MVKCLKLILCIDSLHHLLVLICVFQVIEEGLKVMAKSAEGNLGLLLLRHHLNTWHHIIIYHFYLGDW
jgi:hypothetical protein